MLAKLKKLLLNNISLKVGALLLSFGLWYFIQGEKEIDAFFRVDVQLSNRPGNLVMTNKVPDSILLTVRGSQSGIKWLQEHPLPAYEIDLTETSAEPVLYRVFPTDFNLPNRVRITRINPQLIELKLENEITKLVPIKPNLLGKSIEGFEIESSRIEPPAVRIVGAESEVNKIDHVFTSEINVAEIRTATTIELPLITQDWNTLELQRKEPVRVTFGVLEKNISAKFENIEIDLVGDYGALSSTPTRSHPAVTRSGWEDSSIPR